MTTIFGIETPELKQSGSFWTASEIQQQPGKWREAAKVVHECRAQLKEFLDPFFAKENARVVFTGAGTSAFVGEVLEPALKLRTGKRFDSVSSTDIVSSPEEFLGEQVPTLLVSFARSGNSPESLAAVQLADQVLNECYHLIVTCNPEGELCLGKKNDSKSFCLVMPEGTNDNGFAMTSSFSCMLLSALCIFSAEENSLEMAETVATYTEALLENKFELARELTQQPMERLVFLGSGPMRGLAREASLKFLELTAGSVVSLHDSPLGFRHGPKSVINDKTMVVQFMATEAYTRLYDQDLQNELKTNGIARELVALDVLDREEGSVLSGLPELDADSMWLCFPYIAFAQMMAFFKSYSMGKGVDNPFPGGEVNRVVEGVIIHPFANS
ncbi:MAG: SIS domain-containing protein [Endozoicomonas sp.]